MSTQTNLKMKAKTLFPEYLMLQFIYVRAAKYIYHVHQFMDLCRRIASSALDCFIRKVIEELNSIRE